MQRLPPELLTATESRRFLDLIVHLCQEHVNCVMKAHQGSQTGDWTTLGSYQAGQPRQFHSLARSSINFDAVRSTLSRAHTSQGFTRSSTLQFDLGTRSHTVGFSSICPVTKDDVDSFALDIMDAPIPDERSSESHDCTSGEDDDPSISKSTGKDYTKEKSRDYGKEGSRSRNSTEYTRLTVRTENAHGSSLGTTNYDAFPLLLAWQEQDYGVRRSSLTFHTSVPSEKTEINYESEFVQPSSACGVSHPSSRQRLAWDILCLTFLVYDMVVVPLQAFDLSGSSIVNTLDWLARAVWTIDMPLSCCVGFYLKGKLQMDFRVSAHHYFTTWFWPDLGLVLTDWISYFVSIAEEQSQTGQSMGVLRMLRIARLMRCLRLLRLLKMQRLLQGVEDLINTEALSIYFKCMKPIIGMVLLVHILACGWYAVGLLSEQNRSVHWLEESSIQGRSKGYQYTTCLHWSLSQFTLSTMDVHAQNLGERIYTVIVLVLGIVAFSSLVGGFTSAVEQLRELKRDETNQFWLLRCLLKDYSISNGLTSRIVRYCDYSYYQQKQKKQFGDVALLKLLSDQLTEELLLEIHAPHLCPHPLFERMYRRHSICLQKVCAKTTRSPSFAKGDSLFTKGEIATGLMLVTDGMCQYGWKTPDGNKNVLGVSPGQDFMCEPSLWTEWTTLGHAKAQSNTNTIEVDAGRFGLVLCDSNPVDWNMVHTYAHRYVFLLNRKDREGLLDIMESLPYPDDDSSEESTQKDTWKQTRSIFGVIQDAKEKVVHATRRMSFHSTRGAGSRNSPSSRNSPKNGLGLEAACDSQSSGGDSPKNSGSKISTSKVVFGRSAPKFV